ncbi:MAG: ABC transporter permease [Tannerella sp.]|nr:ABC transporter permease [Tannerella sp.]
MRQRKAVSIINIAGLVLGITSTILIMGYVFYEKSYDAYHDDADDIYRIQYDRYRGETLLWKTANSFYPSAPYLKENFPEVENYFNLVRNHNIEIFIENAKEAKKSFFEEKTYFAPSSMIDILHIPMVSGNNNSLDEPNTMIISEEIARKYFKDTDPLGRKIKVNNNEEYIITGVYKKLPHNTHIKSDLFFSLSTYISRNKWLETNWGWDLLHSYVKLKPGTDHLAFGKRAFPQMVEDNYAHKQAVNSERDDYYLQPIKDIHLFSAVEYETEPPGNGAGVNILLGFAIFFMVIAWINYINLVTARSIERAKEVGIKKVCGCNKAILIRQFIGEAFVFNLFCIIISLILIWVLMPVYRYMTGIEDFSIVLNAKFWIIMLVIMLAGIFLSSLYPAFALSSFKEIDVLKGNFKNSRQGVSLRKALVTFQIFLSLVLLIGTAVVYKQVKYLTSKDIGYKYQSVLVVKAPRTNEESSVYMNRLEVLKERFLSNTDITGFTVTSDIPGKEIENFFGCYKKGDDPGSSNGYYRTDVDPEYISFFKAKLLAGRDFTELDKQSGKKLIFNIKALQRLGYNDPDEAIGKFVMTGPDNEYEIIGVMDDMNYFSVKAEPMPTVFTLRNDKKRYLLLKYDSSTNLHDVISTVESGFNTIFPNNALDYHVLEDRVANTIKTDTTFALIFGIASFLAIVISIIGIMGLIIITINQNLKALGIRKVLGASLITTYIFLWRLFYKQFIVASVIALPVAYYAFTKWVLEKYVYHISISLSQLILPVFIILLILMLVIYIFAKRAFAIKVIRILKME